VNLTQKSIIGSFFGGKPTVRRNEMPLFPETAISKIACNVTRSKFNSKGIRHVDGGSDGIFVKTVTKIASTEPGIP